MQEFAVRRFFLLNFDFLIWVHQNTLSIFKYVRYKMFNFQLSKFGISETFGRCSNRQISEWKWLRASALRRCAGRPKSISARHNPSGWFLWPSIRNLMRITPGDLHKQFPGSVKLRIWDELVGFISLGTTKMMRSFFIFLIIIAPPPGQNFIIIFTYLKSAAQETLI